MTRFCKYIDDQPSLFFWDLDEIIILSSFFVIGMLVERLLLFLAIGIGIRYFLVKLKKEKSEGFLFHILYWWGILSFKKCPPGYVRKFVE